MPWRYPHRDICLHTGFDCLGRPFGVCYKYTPVFGSYDIQPGVTKIWAYGVLRHGMGLGDGVIVDVRTVEMIAAGCCPPDIMLAYLGTEGMPG